ncbi:DUF2399 domain-containing protein [Mesorhizobium sp.]|uniref:DUF2399 domain-containing protein n=1 Tax=Mesorhizobium sp. TaxID=1871066 RepID=UPI000FE9FF21|nr:MAG: DUF2399 domain-containing protein [Mesorhizobium sp.]RWK51186.1 MAG: DUF2399 domain-containing protein [Mesorhizobium sp.]RWK95772.1 MAG: DUF2399 domain-containing protein [Mesorhizobium sp.]TIQ32112.1 MAG: DUF2399 domain-containing protein [Mesorhizobium sp.]TIR00184.1 MAG: DUF2399 domain-containing protein [Mesorhizobium sp.]
MCWADHHLASDRFSHQLGGKVAEASWDVTLAAAMRHHRVAIAEEALAASLLPDLDNR